MPCTNDVTVRPHIIVQELVERCFLLVMLRVVVVVLSKLKYPADQLVINQGQPCQPGLGDKARLVDNSVLLRGGNSPHSAHLFAALQRMTH